MARFLLAGRFWGRLSWGALFALWSVPFLIARHALPVLSFDGEWVAFLCTLIFGVAVLMTGLSRAQDVTGSRTRRASPDVPRIALLPFGIVVALAVQFAVFAIRHRLAGDWQHGSLAGLHEPLELLLVVLYALGLLVAVIAGHWVAGLSGQQYVMRTVAWALVAGGALSLVAELIQALAVDHAFQPFVSIMVDTVDRRLYGNLGQPNHLGTYLAWAGAATLMMPARANAEGRPLQRGGRPTEKRTLRSWRLCLQRCARYGFLFAVFVGMAATGSRTALWQVVMIVLCAAAAPVSAAAPGRDGSSREMWLARVSRVAWVAMLAVAAYGTMTWANQRFGLALTLSGAGRMEDTGGNGYRLALVRSALDIWRDHVWTGAGWGELPTEFLERAGTYGFAEPANSAHNLVLDLLAQTGIVGTLLILLPVARWLIFVMLASRSSSDAHAGPTGGASSDAIRFGLVLVVLVLIHALFEFPQNFAYFLMPIGVVMGALDRPAAILEGAMREGAMREGAMPSSRHRSARQLMGLLLLSGALLLGFARVDYARAQMAYRMFGGYAYVIHPSLLFANYGELGMVLEEPLGGQELAAELRDTRIALHLSIEPALLEREVVLLALSGQKDQETAEARRLWFVAGRHRPESRAEMDAMFVRVGRVERWDTLVAPAGRDGVYPR